MLKSATIQPSNMVTEAFSGAQAPISHTGDHVSGLFPGCHVVPQTTFNLVAVGPYLDNIPNSVIILSATLALQLNNIDLKTASKAPDPRAELVNQLLSKDEHGNYRVSIDTVGTRVGPGSLYYTDLLHRSKLHVQHMRSKLINSARTGLPWDNLQMPDLKSYLTSPTSRASAKQTKSSSKPLPVQASPKPAIITPDHAAPWTTSTTTEKALIELRNIHCALGHPANDVLLDALQDSVSPHHQHLRKYVKLMDKCNVCPMGTQRASPHPSTATSRSTEYLARLILDVSGRQPVASLSGCWYFLLIVDDATRMKWVELLKSVTQVSAVFDNFLRTVVRQGTTGALGKVRCVQLVRTDNGPDFNCNKFRQVLRQHSITHEPSPPDASQQRGIVERGIGVLSAITRASLFWSKAPLQFWGECVKNHSTPTSNNRPNKSNPKNMSPYRMANPSRPSQLDKLRPFGCLSFTYIKVLDRQGKLNPASSCGFFAGYGLTPDGTINGFRVMNLRTHRFTTKFNVKFNVQLPALRYALSALVNSPQQMLVGRNIQKRFTQGTFTGTVTGFSTVDNVTLYDISYTDGDSEQMDLMDVLKHIAPIQDDMRIHRPQMHKRLRESTKHDRARLGKDLLVAPTTTTAPSATNSITAIPQPTSTIFLRRSKRKQSTPNRLTSTKLGSSTGSASLPIPLQTHTPNKANASTFGRRRREKHWRSRHAGHSKILLMVTMLVNATTTYSMPGPPPNTVINGIPVHRYSSASPPVPNTPARNIPSPKSYDDAVYGQYASYWRPAIQKEIDSLFRYGVWKLEPLPPGALVLPCKFVFKVKPDGNDPPGIDKFKCRYCGKGFFQRKGVHFICSYAPVASEVGTRLTVAIATEFNWPLEGIDVRNAYLNAPLDSRVVLFVQPPPTVRVPKGYGLRLCKGLYGTMQGGNRWAVHKHEKLTELGLTRNPAEPSLYHRHDSHGFVITSIIVDDFQITGWPPSAVARLKHQLKETWDITDLGPLKYFASIEVKRNPDTRTTTLKQTGYIDDMLHRYGLSDSYGKPTPCTTAIYNQRLLEPTTDFAPMFGNDYRSQVGSLGYLRRTRPDLCVALGVSAQFAKLGRHGPAHYRALRNIMRHCSATKHFGLRYVSSGKSFRDPWDVSGHVDSDWATWKGSRRSRTGYLVYLNKMLIAFGSKLQSATATSSAEAEYMALAHIVKVILWIVNMIEAIPGQFVRRPILIHEDNKPCISLANNHAASKFTRHIGIAHHFLRDHFESGNRQFKLVWTQSKSQLANGMTKPLPKSEFISFRDTVVSDQE